MKTFGFPDPLEPLPPDPRLRAGRQPIATAPKDGTVIDLWIDEARVRSCRWGKPGHTCGEAGRYCDSDWHSEPAGLVNTATNCTLDEAPTHWMPLPEPPQGALPHV